MKIIKRWSRSSALCLAFLICAFFYGLILPFCWGNDPSDTYGTLSLLCENHIPWFWLWAALTGGAFLLNLEHLYEKHGCRSRFLDACVVLSLLGLLLTAATLRHSIQTINPKRVLHWIGAILYAGFLLAAFFLFFLRSVRQNKGFLPFLLLTAATIVGVPVWLLVFGRNGYMEMIPIALFQVFLFLLNFTPLVKPARKEEA